MRAWWGETLSRPLPETGWAQYGDAIHLLPTDPDNWTPLRPVRAGLRVARLNGQRLEPDHALALTLTPADVHQTIDLSAAAPGVGGVSARGNVNSAGPEGWVLVTVEGYALGWGKRVQGILKNHYPRRLRIR